jgi:hypothetical protein
MKLAQLSAKPQLIRVALDDQETVAEYGELEFWIYDRQPMDTFVKLATLEHSEFDKIADIVANMILDEDGSKIIKDGATLPTPLMIRAIQKVVETLGKSQASTTPTSTVA